jgi:hypothetical protein
VHFCTFRITVTDTLGLRMKTVTAIELVKTGILEDTSNKLENS